MGPHDPGRIVEVGDGEGRTMGSSYFWVRGDGVGEDNGGMKERNIGYEERKEEIRERKKEGRLMSLAS